MKQTPLPLILKLCRTLEEEKISYCHWKSTTALERSATGDNDLDLLISRDGAQPFNEILYRLGFKEVQAPPEQQLSGVLDFYGYDAAADKLVHVHAHYQLVLGDDMTKNYRLPIEALYLASAHQGELFRVPVPELELIVLVVRMMLKHGTWDALLTRQGQLPHSAQQELADLQKRSCQQKVHEVLQHTLPYFTPALFERCLRVLQPGFSRWQRLQEGQRLHFTLRGHARRPRVTDICLKLWRRVTRKVRARVFGLPRKRFASGGVLIALVGGDGAGKSTAVEGLYRWLAKDFSTDKVHLGKPPWSPTTRVVRGTLKLTSHLERLLKPSVRVTPGGNSPALLRRARVLRNVCASHDRYHAYLRARRAATQGNVVICDRFPLPQLTLMDAPEPALEAARGQLTRGLLQLERRWYAAISAPELLIVLKLDPEVAVQRVLGRSTDEDADLVWIRSKEVWDHNWQGTRAYVIDASPSSAEILVQLKTLVWSRI